MWLGAYFDHGLSLGLAEALANRDALMHPATACLALRSESRRCFQELLSSEADPHPSGGGFGRGVGARTCVGGARAMERPGLGERLEHIAEAWVLENVAEVKLALDAAEVLAWVEFGGGLLHAHELPDLLRRVPLLRLRSFLSERLLQRIDGFLHIIRLGQDRVRSWLGRLALGLGALGQNR